MPVTQYIGSRYVPLFADPIEWSGANTYEPLTIVVHEGNSYTSKQAVPKGIDIDNEVFWALTGNYNAQIELYRRETAAAKSAADNAQNDIDTLLPSADFSSTNTIKKYVDDSVAQFSEVLPIDDFDSENTVKDYIDNSVSQIANIIPNESFSSENTVKDYIDSVKDYVNSIVPNPYNAAEFEIVTDGYDTTVNAYITCVKLPKNLYRMNQFEAYTDMQAALNYKDVFKKYTNTIMCAPNLRADYFIRDGVGTGQQADEPWCLLCVDDDCNYNYVECYGTLPSAAPLILQGVKQALFVWEPIIVNGIPYDINRVPTTMSSRDTILFNTHPRFVIGWDDGNTYLVAISGSIPFSAGLTHADLLTLMQKLEIDNAINCDGGGSTQLWICPSAYNLVYNRSASTVQQGIPNNARAKPMTGFSTI